MGPDFNGIEEGHELPVLLARMDRKTYFEYNRLTNELNPLHFDKDYAGNLGFRDIVVAGVYTYSFICRQVEEWLGDSGRIMRVETVYHSPVYIEEHVTHRARVEVKNVGDRTAEIQTAATDREGALLASARISVLFF